MNQKLHDKLKQVMNKMCSDRDTCEDLFQDILFKLETNEKYKTLSDKEKVYYFIGVVRHQVYSTNSSYFRQYKKHQFVELQEEDKESVVDETYIDKPDMIWVKEMMELELKKNPSFWYNKMLFELYIEKNGVIEKVYQKTKIPRYSIKETINEMKIWLKQKWEESN